MYEYGTLRSVKVISRRERGRRGNNEGMNQTRTLYTYMEMSQ
jgi:hypothetical protein